MPDLDPILLLAIAALFLAIVAWGGAVSLNRRLGLHRARTEELQQQLDLVRQSIGGLTAGAVGMDRRMQRLEAREKLLSERQETFEIQQADEQPYGQAIRMVQQGAGAGRLVDELDLSHSEAELIVRMHGCREYA
jgi:hypothetical protein